MAADMNSAILELGDLPDEIILKVFASLDVKDLLNCGQVSKRFRSISREEFLWQRIDLSGQNIKYICCIYSIHTGQELQVS